MQHLSHFSRRTVSTTHQFKGASATAAAAARGRQKWVSAVVRDHPMMDSTVHAHVPMVVSYRDMRGASYPPPSSLAHC